MDLPSSVRLSCSPATPSGVAFRTILAELGLRASLHRRRFLESPDAGSLHGLRVAIRRARSALSDVRGVIVGVQRTRLRTGLEGLGRLTGPLRDLDVLIESLSDDGAGPGSSGHSAELRDALDHRIAAERDRVGSGLEPTSVEVWLRGFESLAEPTGRRASEAIEHTAERTLRRAERRFVRAGERAAVGRTDAEIHRLRIRGKRLRYGLEFFGGVLSPDRDALTDEETLRTFQDELGMHNDLATQLPLLESVRSELRTNPARDDLDRMIESHGARLSASRRAILEGWQGHGWRKPGGSVDV